MSFDPVSYLMGSKNGGGGGGTAQPPMTETTWAALKALRDGGNLVPGMQYRITDYETIITGSYDLSMIGASGYLHNAGVPDSHPFDVIVVADDESHLNENARAALRAGTNYFTARELAGWRLKYSLDNDTTKYTWANANGKGLIWWMEDDWNNKAGYDFKNIRFLRYALKVADAQGDYTPAANGKLAYDASTQPNRYGGFYQLYMALQAYMKAGSYVNPWRHAYKGSQVADYDFAVGGNILGAVQMAEPNATYLSTFGADWYYTFDYYDADNSSHADASRNGHQKIPCTENYISLEKDTVSVALLSRYDVLGLGGSVWETNSVFTDSLSESAWNNISHNYLSEHNWANTFGDNCYRNTFGDNCYSNTFGDNCDSNTFGDSCYSNTFGDNCDSNTFGDNCYSNTFGDNCYRNTFGDSCYSNTFGDNCYRNTFGDSCYSNTFGDNCDSNTFGTNDTNNNLRGYIRYAELGDRCVYVTVNSLGAGSYFDGLEAGDFVQGLEVPAAQISQRGRYRLENYTNPGGSYVPSGGSATLIHKTGYGQETAVTTADGGTTWA